VLARPSSGRPPGRDRSTAAAQDADIPRVTATPRGGRRRRGVDVAIARVAATPSDEFLREIDAELSRVADVPPQTMLFEGMPWGALQEAPLARASGTCRYAPGGGWADHDLADDRAPVTFYAYAAWAACLAPPERLLVLNVFSEGEAAVPKLRAFLTRHGLSTTAVPSGAALRAMVKARHRRWRRREARRAGRGLGRFCA